MTCELSIRSRSRFQLRLRLQLGHGHDSGPLGVGPLEVGPLELGPVKRGFPDIYPTGCRVVDLTHTEVVFIRINDIRH